MIRQTLGGGGAIAPPAPMVPTPMHCELYDGCTVDIHCELYDVCTVDIHPIREIFFSRSPWHRVYRVVFLYSSVSTLY